MNGAMLHQTHVHKQLHFAAQHVSWGALTALASSNCIAAETERVFFGPSTYSKHLQHSESTAIPPCALSKGVPAVLYWRLKSTGFAQRKPTYSANSLIACICNQAAICNACRFFNTVLTWLINPIVLGSIIVFIAFWLIIARGQLKRYFKESTKLKEEFDKYRREMQVKVSQLMCMQTPAQAYCIYICIFNALQSA